MCTVENLWISRASLSKLEIFQCSWTLPNIKYNYEVLFMGQLYWLFIYASKYFSQTIIVNSECSDLENNINSLNYLQCAEVEQGCQKTSIINHAFNYQLLNAQLRSTLYSRCSKRRTTLRNLCNKNEIILTMPDLCLEMSYLDSVTGTGGGWGGHGPDGACPFKWFQ